MHFSFLILQLQLSMQTNRNDYATTKIRANTRKDIGGANPKTPLEINYFAYLPGAPGSINHPLIGYQINNCTRMRRLLRKVMAALEEDVPKMDHCLRLRP